MNFIARVIQSVSYNLVKVDYGFVVPETLDEATPDLISLDISIPGVHGLKPVQQIKDDQRLAKIPLMATMAKVLMGDRDRCLERVEMISYQCPWIFLGYGKCSTTTWIS